MSLYTDLRQDVADILSDPDIRTGDVRLRRVTAVTPAANSWDDPVESAQIIRVDATVFTREAKYVAGTLAVERGDDITVSALATVIEEDGVATNQRIVLEIQSSDEVIVDGDVRRVVELVRIPDAGDVTAWIIRVAD